MILHTPCHSVPSLIYCKSQGRPSLQGNAWMGTTLQQLFQNAWLDPQLTATILIPCQPMQHWLLCNYGLWIHFHLFRSSVNKEPLYRQFCFSESLRHYLFILIHLNTNLSISRSEYLLKLWWRCNMFWNDHPDHGQQKTWLPTSVPSTYPTSVL